MKKICLKLIDMPFIKLIFVFEVLILGCLLYLLPAENRVSTAIMIFIILGFIALIIVLTFRQDAKIHPDKKQARFVYFNNESLIIENKDKSTIVIPYNKIESIHVQATWVLYRLVLAGENLPLIKIISAEKNIEFAFGSFGVGADIIKTAKSYHIRVTYNSEETERNFERLSFSNN